MAKKVRKITGKYRKQFKCLECMETHNTKKEAKNCCAVWECKNCLSEHFDKNVALDCCRR